MGHDKSYTTLAIVLTSILSIILFAAILLSISTPEHPAQKLAMANAYKNWMSICLALMISSLFLFLSNARRWGFIALGVALVGGAFFMGEQDRVNSVHKASYKEQSAKIINVRLN